MDRRLKSIVGTGIVNAFHDWSSPTNYPDQTWFGVRLVDTVHYGSTNSPRSALECRNWHGQSIRTEKPDWNTNSPIVEYREFVGWNDANPTFLYRSTRNNAIGAPVEVYRFDLDFATANSIHVLPPDVNFIDDPVSSNRLQRVIRTFSKQSGNWFFVTTNVTVR